MSEHTENIDLTTLLVGLQRVNEPKVMTQNTSEVASLTDASGRRITYLRVSCDRPMQLRMQLLSTCRRWQPAPKSEVLSMEELARFCSGWWKTAFRKYALPVVESRSSEARVTSLVHRLKTIPGLKEIAMTTNGHLLSRHAQALKDAGLDRLTSVSTP